MLAGGAVVQPGTFVDPDAGATDVDCRRPHARGDGEDFAEVPCGRHRIQRLADEVGGDRGRGHVDDRSLAADGQALDHGANLHRHIDLRGKAGDQLQLLANDLLET